MLAVDCLSQHFLRVVSLGGRDCLLRTLSLGGRDCLLYNLKVRKSCSRDREGGKTV